MPGVLSRCFGQRSVKPVWPLPTNQPTSPSTQACKWAGMPKHHPLPTLSKDTLEAGDAPFLRALLLVSYSVFGLEMEVRGGVCCVLCVGPPAPCGPPVLVQPPLGVLPPPTMMWLLPPTIMWLPPPTMIWLLPLLCSGFVRVLENNSSFELRLSSITVALCGAQSQSMCFLCKQCNCSQEMQQSLLKRKDKGVWKRRQKESFPDSCAWSRSLMTKASSPQEWTKWLSAVVDQVYQ